MANDPEDYDDRLQDAKESTVDFSENVYREDMRSMHERVTDLLNTALRDMDLDEIEYCSEKYGEDINCLIDKELERRSNDADKR